jgi:CRISPR/Cas system CSM-associated protein Csm3 (group 7 of RAMP superfamily)
MHHRIQIDLRITFSSPWHAGSGEGKFSVDRMIRRNARNQPYIPASTLKGIVRQSCEKLSHTCGFDRPSDPHSSDLTRQNSFIPYEKMDSPVDRLFGSRFVQGGIFFRDCQTTEETHPNQTTVRNRIARYRILGTARSQQLFNTEYAPSLALQTRINGWHDNLAAYPDELPYAYCLLIAGILAVERIGGDKSTGAGWLDGPIHIEKILYNGEMMDLKTSDLFDLLDPELYSESRGES